MHDKGLIIIPRKSLSNIVNCELEKYLQIYFLRIFALNVKKGVGLKHGKHEYQKGRELGYLE